jgi:hypothetical protein
MREHHRELSASLGAPEPHDFTVRVSSRSSGAASASIAARNSAYRDDAYAPLHEAGCVKERHGSTQTRSGIFLASRLDGWNRVEVAGKFRFFAQAFWRLFSAVVRSDEREIERILLVGQITLPVIASASEAIQNREAGDSLDCFVASAPRNDGDATVSQPAHARPVPATVAATTRPMLHRKARRERRWWENHPAALAGRARSPSWAVRRTGSRPSCW